MPSRCDCCTFCNARGPERTRVPDGHTAPGGSRPRTPIRAQYPESGRSRLSIDGRTLRQCWPEPRPPLVEAVDEHRHRRTQSGGFRGKRGEQARRRAGMLGSLERSRAMLNGRSRRMPSRSRLRKRPEVRGPEARGPSGTSMPFELSIALRYLLAKRKQAFISLISLISTIGVAVGVTALVIALALMTGLQGELRDRILGSTAHVYVWKQSGLADYRAEAAKLRAVPGRRSGRAPRFSARRSPGRAGATPSSPSRASTPRSSRASPTLAGRCSRAAWRRSCRATPTPRPES